MAPVWLPDTSFIHFRNIDDELFDVVLLRITARIANRRYNTDFFNADNVYDYIDFKDGCYQNLHRDNLLLVKAF